MKTNSFLFIIVAIVFANCTNQTNEIADFVIKNAKIYTVNESHPWAEAIAIKGENIIFVGSDEEVKQFIGEQTIVNDALKNLILPGIISTHEHATFVMALSSGLTLDFTSDADKMLNTVNDYVTNNPDAPMFSFGGAFEGTVDIFREDIDSIVSDKPFLMIAASGHGGWANSKALEKAGILQDYSDPIDYFDRQKDGTPTGYIGSSAAVFYMMDKLGIIQKETMMTQAEGVFDYLASNGITTTQEVALIPGTEEIVFTALQELEKQGKMKVRFRSATMIQRSIHIDDALEALKKYGKIYSSEIFDVNTLKIHGDGAFEGRTAGMLEPYSDDLGNDGLLSISQDEATYAMLEAAKAGYNIHTHAIGDRTNHVMLNAMQVVRASGLTKSRITMGHTMLVNEKDKPRFKELDIIVNTFGAEAAVPNEVLLQRLGKERYSKMMPMKSFLNQGTKVVLSADWPTAPLNPFLQISIVMSRSNPGQDEYLPQQTEALSLEEAIRAYTIDAAYCIGAEDYLGSLVEGKRADLIVIDTDIFEATSDEIAETKVLSTIMNGKNTFLSEEAKRLIEDYEEFMNYHICH